MTGLVLLVVNDPPYGIERVYNALRFRWSMFAGLWLRLPARSFAFRNNRSHFGGCRRRRWRTKTLKVTAV
jgi:hypothetical protein